MSLLEDFIISSMFDNFGFLLHSGSESQVILLFSFPSYISFPTCLTSLLFYGFEAIHYIGLTASIIIIIIIIIIVTIIRTPISLLAFLGRSLSLGLCEWGSLLDAWDVSRLGKEMEGTDPQT
jgi:hypothetical protein